MTSRASSLRTLGLLGALYFSQGLPFGFFTQGLPVLLRQRGFSLAEIGFSSLLAAPWAPKWLWAPLVDRWYWPALGRRRSWIVPLQLATAAIYAGSYDPVTHGHLSGAELTRYCPERVAVRLQRLLSNQMTEQEHV